jgi:protein gp37
MADYFRDRSIPKNVWLGVAVENQAAKSRIDFLRTPDCPFVLFRESRY